MRRKMLGAALAVVAALSAVPTAGAVSRSAPASCPAHVAWTTFGGNNARTGTNACETAIGVANAPSLHYVWKQTVSGKTLAQPTYAPGLMINGVAHNVLFVTDEGGTVQALDTANGAVLWTRQFGTYSAGCSVAHGVSTGVLLDLATNTGYLVDGQDLLYKIDLHTGQNVAGFAPIAVAAPSVDHVWGAITMRGQLAYIATASYCDANKYYGRVIAVDVAQHKIAATWTVVPPSTGKYGGGIWGPGGVSVDAANGAVYAATGNSISGEHAGYAEQVVRLDATLHVQAANYASFTGFDVDYGSTPLLFQPSGCPALLVAKNKSGVLVVYKRDAIASGPFQRVQLASNQDGNFNGVPAYSPATRTLVVSNSSDSAPYTHGIVAFSVDSNCKLAFKWQQTAGINQTSVAPPMIAHGVAYYSDGPGHTVRAFDLRTGSPLWNSGRTIGGPTYAAPLVADGHVYAASWDGHIYAFRL